ncbi:MAG: 50S ribosomal protein L21e [Candidatus Micrarchaeota archaeon]
MKRSHGYYSGRSRALKLRGRVPITRQLAEFKEGDAVRIRIDSRVRGGKISLRYNGRVCKVIGRQGAAYRVSLTDVRKPKQFVVSALHLQKA